MDEGEAGWDGHSPRWPHPCGLTAREARSPGVIPGRGRTVSLGAVVAQSTISRSRLRGERWPDEPGTSGWRRGGSSWPLMRYWCSGSAATWRRRPLCLSALTTCCACSTRPPAAASGWASWPEPCILTRSGVTRLANRLERAGLLRREGHAQDRRGSCAILTDRGRDEWRRARAVFERTVAEQFGSHLSDAEAETLNAVLGRIVTAETGADCQ